MMTWVRTNQWNGGARGRLRGRNSRRARTQRRRFGGLASRRRKRPSASRERAPRGRGRVEAGETDGARRRNRRSARAGCTRSRCWMEGKSAGRVFADESTGFAWRAEFYHQRGVERWLFEGWERTVSDDGKEAVTPALAHRTPGGGTGDDAAPRRRLSPHPRRLFQAGIIRRGLVADERVEQRRRCGVNVSRRGWTRTA